MVEYTMSGHSSVPYDRGWSWVVVLGIGMMHVFLIGYVKTFGLLFVELQNLFNLTSKQTAWVSTAMLLSIDILSPLGTALGDRFGSRVVVMTGGMLVCLSLALSSLLYNIQYIIVVLGVMFGVGATLCYAPSMIMVAYYFKRRLGLANALAVTGSSVGQFLLPPVVTLLLDTYSLGGTLLILAGIMFNLTLAGALLRPVSYYTSDQSLPSDSDTNCDMADELHNNCPKKRLPNTFNDMESKHYAIERENGLEMMIPPPKEKFKETLQYASTGDLHCSMNVPTSKILVKNYRQQSTCMTFVKSIFDVAILRNPIYSIFALGCTCVNFAYIGTFRYLPAHCQDMGIHEHQRAALLSIVGIADLLSRLVVGLIADTDFIRLNVKRYRLLAFSLLALGANGLFLVHCRTYWLLTTSCVLYGVFGGFYMTLVSVSLVDMLGAQHLSRAWGIMLLLFGATTVGEPLLLGHLRDMTGTYLASFQVCAGLFFAGGVLVFIAPFAKHCSR